MSNFDLFLDFLSDEQLDIIGLSETWLSAGNSSDSIGVPGYTLVRNDRERRGGGVAIYLKKSFKFNVLDIPLGDSGLEQIWIGLKVNGKKFCFGSIYRPPDKN